ncbi:syntaxin-12 [Scophthalmus maximus]|uniref:Syntaxin-12 n=2 Tax=Scophthalmus maximus TaxID=52904 RepID=A0A8D3AQG5_SCOMX|nr:syntaxin-12 [Scophthalmus maximus]
MSSMRADSSWSQPRDTSSLVQACTFNIQKINHNSGQIKHLLLQLGTRQETSGLQERLQQLQHYTNQLAKETNRHLKELGARPPPLSPSEQRQQKLQRERLMSDFSAALNNFQAVQRSATEKEKETVARARAGSRVTGDGGNVSETLVTFEKEDEWSQTQTEEPVVTEEDLELIKERETNIRQMEADIMDVNQIFKDLAVMIHDQGDMIDSIEANVESAEVHVDRGAVQLQKASYHQRKSRKRMCMLAMVMSLVLTILIIIIWQALK